MPDEDFFWKHNAPKREPAWKAWVIIASFVFTAGACIFGGLAWYDMSKKAHVSYTTNCASIAGINRTPAIENVPKIELLVDGEETRGVHLCSTLLISDGDRDVAQEAMTEPIVVTASNDARILQPAIKTDTALTIDDINAMDRKIAFPKFIFQKGKSVEVSFVTMDATGKGVDVQVSSAFRDVDVDERVQSESAALPSKSPYLVAAIIISTILLMNALRLVISLFRLPRTRAEFEAEKTRMGALNNILKNASENLNREDASSEDIHNVAHLIRLALQTIDTSPAFNAFALEQAEKAFGRKK